MKYKKQQTTITTLLFLWISTCGHTSIVVQQHQPNQTIQAQQWEVLDLSFTVESVSSQAVDVAFTARLEAENGESLTVPGFYNGDNTYLIRFSPTWTGICSYTTQSNLPDLDNLKGKIKIVPAVLGRKGGILLDENNSRLFRYQNGESYYPIAFESDWLFALDAENKTDIPKTRKFVNSLAQNGYNQVVMNVFAYDVTWEKDEVLPANYEYGSPRVFPFAGNNTEPDHSQLNIDYFKRLDRVIDYLDQKGIAAHLMIYVWNKKVNWPTASSEEDNRYFDYVVKRYQAFPNMIWDISKEALGYGHKDEDYISQRITRLRRLDAYQRLVTVHDYRYCKRFPEQVDFISVQTWESELYNKMRNVCIDFPNKPIQNIEHGGYEESPYEVFTGCYTSAEVCLERAYQCVFAGSYPSHYWQGAAWNVIIPDITVLAPQDRPHLDYYRHLSAFVKKYNIGQLEAGQKWSKSGFCLNNGDNLYIYYAPKENFNIYAWLPLDKKNCMMTVTWFDPFTGRFGEGVREKANQLPSFKNPPGDGFSILIVEVETSNL